MSKPRHSESFILARGEAIDVSNFESLFNTTVARTAESLLPAAADGENHAQNPGGAMSPYLARLTDICKLFATRATTEEQLKLVTGTYEDRLLAELHEAGDDKRGGIALAANITYRYFFATAIKLNLFESPGFVHGLLESATAQSDERQPAATKVLRRAWTLALGEYLIRTEDELVRPPNRQDTLGDLPRTSEDRQRASSAVKTMHEAGVLFEEGPSNFWRQFALSAARRTPEFLPVLVEFASNPNIYCQIIWGKNVDWWLSKIPKGEKVGSPIAVATEHVRQLLLQYAKNLSRNTAFIQEILRQSTPKERTSGGAPVTQFGLMEMIQFADRKVLELRQEAQKRGDTTFLVPPPLLVDDNGAPKHGARVDHSVVMRALSRLLYFTRPKKRPRQWWSRTDYKPSSSAYSTMGYRNSPIPEIKSSRRGAPNSAASAQAT